jgi:hypothetical protein
MNFNVAALFWVIQALSITTTLTFINVVHFIVCSLQCNCFILTRSELKNYWLFHQNWIYVKKFIYSKRCWMCLNTQVTRPGKKKNIRWKTKGDRETKAFIPGCQGKLPMSHSISFGEWESTPVSPDSDGGVRPNKDNPDFRCRNQESFKVF